MSTNFLPLPSGGFIASQPKPCYTLSWFPTLNKYYAKDGRLSNKISLDKTFQIGLYYKYQTTSGSRTVTLAAFFMPFSGLYSKYHERHLTI
jgi:hypothetical protein